jgi:Secretion system C-terminal sorting domain
MLFLQMFCFKSTMPTPILRIFIVAATVLTSFALRAQTITTVNDGPWNVGTTWSSNPIIPNAANSDSIIVMHNVTIPSGFSVTIDGTRIISGRTLTVQSGGTLNLAAVPTALKTQGTLIGANGSSITGSNGTNISFTGSGIYRHEFTTTQGVIPNATWNAASRLEITGYSSFVNATAAGNWSQTFGNFVWNTPSLTNIFNLNGLVTNIAGSLDIQNTGTGALFLSASTSPTITIAQDLLISGTGRTFFATNSSAAPGTTINIGRDFSITSSNTIASGFNTGGLTTVHVTRDFVMNSSNANLRLGSNAASSIGVLRIGRNFTLTAGTLTESSADPGYGEVAFTGTSGTQHTFQNTGTVSNTVNYTVAANNTLITLGESALVGGVNSTLTVNGTLRLGSVNTGGAIQSGSGPGPGNVRTVNRVYNSGSSIVYGGAATQFMGSGNPSVITTTVVIDNASGVNLAASITAGNITVTSGNFNIANFPLIVSGTLNVAGGNVVLTTTGTPRTLTLNGLFSATGGELQVNSGATEATVNFNGTVSGTNGFTSTGTNTILNFGGTGAFGIFPASGAMSVKVVNINRPSGTVGFANVLTVVDLNATNGDVDIDNRLTVTDDLNLATGTTLFFQGATLDLRSQFNNEMTGGVLSADGASSLQITGTGALGTLVFSGSGNTLGNFLLNRSTPGTLVTLNSPLTISTLFELRRGTFLNTSGLTMGNGTMLRRNSQATLNGVAAAGGPYDLDYTGTSLTTGLEAQGSLQNVSSNVTGTVTLNVPLTATSLQIVTGTFTSGTNAISVATVVNGSVFNAPATTLTLTGDFTNNATFNRNNGTVVFNGTSSILGSVNPTFNNVTIAGVLNSPALLNLAGDFTNNGTFNTLGGTVGFNGSVIQNISGSTLTNFQNISVTNTTSPVSVSVQSNQNLIGTLTLGANAKFDADGSANTSVFTLISTNDTPVQDARIATIPTGASVLGEVTAQRYMSMEGTGSRYISSPVSSARVVELQDDFSVTGSFPQSSFPCTGCSNNGSSLRWYNETVLGAISAGYRQLPSAGGSDQEILEVGRGYYAYMWNGSIQITMDVTGTINAGTIALPVSHTPSAPPQPAADGWNLLGNPYPSSIAWDGGAGWIFSNPAHFGPTVTVYDIMGNDNKTYNYVDASGDLPGGVIAMGQAFWVYASTPGATLSITEQAKVVNGGSFYRRGNPSSQLIVEVAHAGMRDRAFLKTNAAATPEFDQDFDAFKLKNENFSVSLVDKDGKHLVMHTLKEIGNDDVIPVMLEVTDPGEYTFHFPEHTKFSNTDLYLIDAQEGVSSKISNGGYTFTISEGKQIISSRFFISQTSKTPSVATTESIVDSYPNPVKDVLNVRVHTGETATVAIVSSTGQVFFKGTMKGETSVAMGHLPDGLYILKVQSSGRSVTRKILKSQTISLR